MMTQPGPTTPPRIAFTFGRGAPRLANWCKAFNRKAKAAHVKATLTAHVMGRRSMGRESHHLQLAVPGREPIAVSFKNTPLDGITAEDLRSATVSLMRAFGLGRAEDAGETPAGVRLVRFVPVFEV